MFKRNKINNLLLILMTFMLGLPFTVRADADIESYTLEQGIPFIGGAGQTLSYGEFSTLFQKFITAVYIIAAVAAFIKIFLAGLKWYTSSGSAKAISQAREDIKNALMGLAFLFLAGTLLVFINPNLNKISSIFIGDIKATPVENTASQKEIPTSKSDGIIKGDIYFTGNNGVPLFKQQDGRWGSYPYPNASHPFADNGCVPTAIAMVITKLTGETITPGDLYKKMNSAPNVLSTYVTSNGDSQNYAKIAALENIKTSSLNPQECLNKGGIPTAVISGKSDSDGNCRQLLGNNGGHMIVITGVNSTNPLYFNVNDPYYNNNSIHLYVAAKAELIRECATSFWCFTK